MVVFFVAFFVFDFATGTSYQTNYLPEAVAVVAGVFLALALERRELAKSDQTRIKAMKGILRRELNRMQKAIDDRKGNYLDTQVWISLVNSGNAAILPMELQEQLFDFYAEVNAHNIETNRCRDAAEEERRNPTPNTMMAHSELSIRIDRKELELSNRLRRLLASGLLGEVEESQE
jgi:hypothetical protein